MTVEHDGDRANRSKSRWVLFAFLGIAGVFVVLEHKAHVLGALPYLLLLACPLLHLFMHRGHGHHRDHESGQ